MEQLLTEAAKYTICGVSAPMLNGVIVSAIRRTGIKSSWLPLISISVGVGLGVLWSTLSALPIVNGIAVGIILGAATSGYYDAVKKVD